MGAKRGRSARFAIGLAAVLAVAGCSSGRAVTATRSSLAESRAAVTAPPSAHTPASPNQLLLSAGPGASLSSPSALGAAFDLSGLPRTSIPLPAGTDLDPSRLIADGDWVLLSVTIESATPSASEAVYAVNIRTGASRKLLDTSAFNPGFLSLAGSQAAWVSWNCSASGTRLSCMSWNITLMDLESGASRVVARGSNPEVAAPGGQGAEPVVPALALSADTLAYSSGDHATGFILTLVSLATGSTRTIALSGPIEEIIWAGTDLAWIEATDYQPAASPPAVPADNSAFYLGARLMLLAAGASSAIEIDPNAPYWLAGSADLLVWDRGGDYLWAASAPDWRPDQSSFIADNPPSVSDGWLGWLSSSPGRPFVVIQPGESVQRVALDGVAISGGWLFLGTQPGTYGPTKLEAVPLSALR